MAAHKSAFKAFDMQSLINKINKSIVAPLPTMYSVAFRSLVKSMLRRNPEVRPSAAELLGHQHLQPYILKIHTKLNSPRRNTYPVAWSESDYIKKTKFMEPEVFSVRNFREKRRSLCNDRTLNPSISETEQDSPCSSTKEAQRYQSDFDHDFAELSLGSGHDKYDVKKSVTTIPPNLTKTPRLTTAKSSNTPRRQITTTKIPHDCSKRDSLPMYGRTCTPQSRRTSLPLYSGALRRDGSPDVSVNAPRMDKIPEFLLTSSEDPLYSITKDRCTVQVVDRALSSRSVSDRSLGSESSNHNSNNAKSQSSSESQHRRFDTSSYQQRAEALEGLLEFSARLLQQQRFDELGVLLKPFGPEKVSPRETAIWLAKSFKETAT